MMTKAIFSMPGNSKAFAETLPVKAAGTRRALGLDLGTATGMAILDYTPGEPITNVNMYLDLLDLSLGTYDSSALRVIRLKNLLSIIDPDIVGFENVTFTPSKEVVASRKLGISGIVARVATASELFGVLKAAVCEWSEERRVPCEGFGITEIKRRATGKGNSNKEAIIAACNKEFGTAFDPEKYESEKTDNMADSAFCLALLLEAHCGAN